MQAGLQNPSRRFNAVDPRHLDIHEDDVRLKRGSQRDDFLTGLRFANDLNVRRCVQQRLDAMAKKWVIIRDQDAEWLHRYPPLALGVGHECASQSQEDSQSHMSRPVLPPVRPWKAVPPRTGVQ